MQWLPEAGPGLLVRKMNLIILFALFFVPLTGGILLSIYRKKGKRCADTLFIASLATEASLTLWYLLLPDTSCHLFSLTESLALEVGTDGVSRVFLTIGVFGFLIAGIFATKYMEHGTRQAEFYSCMLLSLTALVGMDISANLITMYLFFECATLLSMPLVLHDRTEESIRAAMKYLFYSIGGAMMALFAIFTLAQHTASLSFAAGGSLMAEGAEEHRTLLEIAALLGVMGFGAKAAMYPLHGWLPTAHPVAPAPASAVLSGVITKAGVLAIIRLIFYSIGPDFLRGSWVQSTWIVLALVTVFMGSMMAYREDLLKKRFAFSSVSQISYILAGIFCMTEQSVAGGLMHVMFHACIKICLFLFAGSVIVNLDKTHVSELKGIGKEMPVTLGAYTIASLGLVGIPPTSGFVSKWYLAVGALESNLPVLSWLTPVVLLVSALLTAGYLLPITVQGFFPGKGFESPLNKREGHPLMWMPIVILAALCLITGIFAGPIVNWTIKIAGSLV